jgi:hypothetical protein
MEPVEGGSEMSVTKLTRCIGLGLGFVAMVLATPGAALGQNTPVHVKLGPASVLWLDGTSSLHEYESHTSQIGFDMARDPASREPANAADLAEIIRHSGIRSVDVRVPVGTLRSGKSGLDRNMMKALRADQYPEIRFHLARYTASGVDTVDIQAEGTLTIAGQERPVTLKARAFRGPGGVWLEGTHGLRMTEFGIKPPTMMMGTIRVGDPVTIHYQLLLSPAVNDAPATSRSN